MTTLTIAAVLLALLLVLLMGGVWIAISLAAVGWFGLQFFTNTPPEVNLFQSFWSSNANWTIAALPLFIWMGEISYCALHPAPLVAGIILARVAFVCTIRIAARRNHAAQAKPRDTEV